MRLLNIYTFVFAEFYGNDIPPYVIASHRWSGQETTHKDIKKRRNTDKEGYKKVEGFCAHAARENHLLAIEG